MNKQETYKLIKSLMDENADLIELAKDLIKECWKHDSNKAIWILSSFENSIEQPADYGCCPSLAGLEHHYKMHHKEDNDE